jgi:hypothetical protein
MSSLPFWLMPVLAVLAVAAGMREGVPGVGFTPRMIVFRTGRAAAASPAGWTLRLLLTPVRLFVAVAALTLWSGLRTTAWGAMGIAVAVAGALMFVAMFAMFGPPPALPRRDRFRPILTGGDH